MPFKIDQNKNKTIRQIKSRIWVMKGGKYTKILAKIWVEGMIRIRDIGGNVLPKFIVRALYGDAMLEFIWMSSNMADGNQQRHLLPSFATKA